MLCFAISVCSIASESFLAQSVTSMPIPQFSSITRSKSSIKRSDVYKRQIVVLTSGAPPFFALFGVVFIIWAIVQAGYHFKNATGKNRFSEFDITEEYEERDPLSDLFSDSDSDSRDNSINPSRFCPYCGAKVEEKYQFCNQCGRKLPHLQHK